MEKSRKYSFVGLAKEILNWLQTELPDKLYPEPPPATHREHSKHVNTRRTRKSPQRRHEDFAFFRDESVESLDSAQYAKAISHILSTTPEPEEPQEAAYIGGKAKHEFWKLWKSNRVLKDSENSEDPRVTYLQVCRNHSLLPKALHIIRNTPPGHLELPGVGLLPEFVDAITKSIEVMKFHVEVVDLSSNGLNNHSGVKLLTALALHSQWLLSLNLSYNKLSSGSAEALKHLFREAKELRDVDLSGMSFGDGATASFLGILLKNPSLICLRLSKCGICKTMVSEKVCKKLARLLRHHPALEVLDLSWNHFKGEHAEKVIRGLARNITLVRINFASNMLGAGARPAVNMLSEVFLQNNTLEELDLSHNMITPNSAFVLAYYLKKNQTLKALQLDGNPIGDKGLHSLLEALEEKTMNFRADQSFLEASSSLASINMQPEEPPAAYDLSIDYDRVKLSQFLDDLDDPELVKDIRLNNKKIELPQANASGWELPKEGSLSITLSQGVSSPRASAKGVSVLSEKALDNYFQLLAEENPATEGAAMIKLIRSFSKSRAVWTAQAIDLVKMFVPGSWEQEQVAYDMIPKLVDGQNLPLLLETLREPTVRNLVGRLGDLLVYNETSPSGKYRLNLSDSNHLALLIALRAFNQRHMEEATGTTDKGMYGTHSLFRNEKMNGVRLEITNQWKAPKNGSLEFDFSWFARLEKPETFPNILSALATTLAGSGASVATLIKVFKLVAPQLVFTTNSLKSFVTGVSANPLWIEEALATGLPRCIDVQNLDFVKNYLMDIDQSDLIDVLCARLGMLYLFNPLRPEGLYRLDLGVYEERKMCELILTLCREEGYQETSFFSYNSQKVDLTPDYLQQLPMTGRFEIVFFSSEPNYELREKLGEELNL